MIDRDFAATKLKLDIIPSSESQSNLLQNSTKKLKELGIPDPKTVRENAIDDVIQWPQVTSGSIFAYIFKKKDFDGDYIQKYKDQKAFSCFNSGFLGRLKFVNFPPKRVQYVLFVMSELHKASMKVDIYGFFLKKLPKLILIFYQHGALTWLEFMVLVIMFC